MELEFRVVLSLNLTNLIFYLSQEIAATNRWSMAVFEYPPLSRALPDVKLWQETKCSDILKKTNQMPTSLAMEKFH
jgi:hypothetical protein